MKHLKLAIYTICASWWIIPAVLYAVNVNSKDTNCMIEYVRTNADKWTIYRFKSGANHIEAGQRSLPGMLPVGYVEWCVMHSDQPISDIINTQYCLFSNFMENAR